MPPERSRLSPRVYLDLARRLDQHIAALQDHPDETVWGRIESLLQGVDALHREGLYRLVELLRRNGGGEALDRAAEDPVVRVFLGLYDLAELGAPAAAGENVGFVPADQVRVRRRERPDGEAGGDG